MSETDSHTTLRPVIEVLGAHARYPTASGPLPVLGGVDLRVHRGEVLAVVGPSGCGKTTLLRALQGLTALESGSVRIQGRPPSEAGTDSGYVFQQPSLFPWWSVRRNVECGLRLRANTARLTRVRRREHAHRLLDLVGLTGFEDFRPTALSGGMRQRVNLARALAIDPVVLLLDEPFSAVDTLMKERLQRVLSDTLHQLGTAAVIVTHDIHEAVFLGDRVSVMSERPGRIVASFEVDEGRPRTEDFQHSEYLAGVSAQMSCTRAPRRWLLGGALALAASVLTGCGTPAGTTGAPTPLSVPLGSVSAAQGAFQYTITKGFFARNGLAVSTPLSAEGQLKSAIVAGPIEFDQLAGGDLMDLYAKHVEVTAVACTATNTGYYLYAGTGTPTVQALAGKTVGVPSLGGAPQVAMQAYLVGHGMATDATRFVALGSIPNVLAALTGHKIDSGLLSTPFNFRADTAGLVNLGYATGPPTPYLVNSDWAAKNPATVSAILRSLIEGTWAYQTHKPDGVAVLGAFLRLDPANPAERATLDKSFDAYLPPVQAPPGRCRASDFAAYARYQPANEQTALANLDPLFNNSYIDALDKQGFYTDMHRAYGPLPKGATLTQVLR